jgi:hypothetical protein
MFSLSLSLSLHISRFLLSLVYTGLFDDDSSVVSCLVIANLKHVSTFETFKQILDVSFERRVMNVVD